MVCVLVLMVKVLFRIVILFCLFLLKGFMIMLELCLISFKLLELMIYNNNCELYKFWLVVI